MAKYKFSHAPHYANLRGSSMPYPSILIPQQTNKKSPQNDKVGLWSIVSKSKQTPSFLAKYQFSHAHFMLLQGWIHTNLYWIPRMGTTILLVKCECFTFKAFSTGVYGYPNSNACDVALRTIRKFIEDN